MRARPWLPVLLSAIAAVLIYLPALRNGFAYDDVPVILLDARVHTPESLVTLVTQGYWRNAAELSLWRPVTTLSFAFDWWISGGSPAWFHLTNLLWHALATALAATLILLLAGPLAALVGGILFAVHPVHVEAVANVVGRAELLAGCAGLAVALVWLRTSAGGARAAALACLFLGALLAKESAIVLPALLVLIDAAAGNLRRGRVGEWFRGRGRDFALLGLAAGAWLLARAAVLGRTLPGAVDPVLEVASGAPARVFTALQAWPHILRLFFFPVTLLADYSARIIMPAPVPTMQTWLGAAILLALLAGGITAARRDAGMLALLLLWVPLALLPVSNLVFPVGVVLAERTLYLPSFAPVLAAGLCAAWAVRHVRPPLLAALALLAAGGLAGRTLTRIPDWRSTDAIFTALGHDRPDSFRARWHLARSAVARGDQARALEEYATALALWPYRRALVLEAARAGATAGSSAFAHQVSAHAVRLWPHDPEALTLAAASALDVDDTTAARGYLRAALQARPRDPLLLRMKTVIEAP